MTRLAWRLGVRRLRRDPQLLLAGGVVLITLVLYLAGAVAHAAQAQAARLDQRYATASSLRAAQPWKVAPAIAVGDRELTVVAVPAGPAATHSRYPGASVVPGPGQMLLSPALASALASGSTRPLLTARLPWPAVGTVGPPGLAGPQELLAVVGLDAAAFQVAPGVDAGGAPAPPVSWVTLAVLATLVLAPAFLLLSTCARVDTRRRERRLATLALVGASRRQLRRVALVDALVLSAPAGAAGLLAAWAVMPLLARTAIGQRFPLTDLRPEPAVLVAIGVGTVLLESLATGWATRRISAEPLRTRRATNPRQPSAVRLLPGACGLIGFLGATAGAQRLSELALGVIELVSLVLVLIGLPLAGPVLVRAGASTITRCEALPGGALVGARRLQRDPATGTRAVTGLVLATFVFGFVSTIDLGAPSRGLPAADVYVLPDRAPVQALLAELAALPGVRAVAPVQYVQGRGTRVLLTTCQGAAQFLAVQPTQGQCQDGAALRRDGAASPPAAGSPPADVTADVTGGATGSTTVTVPVVGRGDVSWPVTGTFTGLDEDPSVSVVLALPLADLAAQPQIDVRVDTDGSTGAALGVINASARLLPLAAAGPAEVVLMSVPQAAQITQALTLVLAAAFVFALIGVAVSLGESLLDRAAVLAMLGAVGLGPRGARQMSATEVGIPLTVLTLPTLGLGSALAYLGGRLLDGDVRLPWPALASAAGAVLVLAVVTFAAAVRITTAVPTSAVLREDAM